MLEPIYQIKEVFWRDVRDKVKKLNSEIYDVIEKIPPENKHKFIQVRYPFGATIVNKGVLCLPTEDGYIQPLHHKSIPESTREKLSYSAIPLALVLHNANEVFVEGHDRIVPLNFFLPGNLFGIFEVMNPLADISTTPLWSVTAGARTTFMLPRITDAIAHKRIRREYNLPIEAPRYLSDHWRIFSGIANQADETNKWYNEVLFFTKEWFDDKNDNSAWFRFHKFLFKTCWIQLQLLRDITEFNLMWESFATAISYRNLKPRPYLIDTVKHLISIANGAAVAFKPATDESAVPLSLIQKAYVDYYQLKNYSPIIMQPTKLTISNSSVYYSLSFPTVLESSPFMRNAPSIMEDERDIKRLIETLKSTLTTHDGSIFNPIKNVTYDFYHTDNDIFGEIQNSKEIASDDPRLNHSQDSRVFCANAPFFRGCIKVSKIAVL